MSLMIRKDLTSLICEALALFGVIWSWNFVNSLLQFLVLLFSLATAALGFYRLWNGKKKK